MKNIFFVFAFILSNSAIGQKKDSKLSVFLQPETNLYIGKNSKFTSVTYRQTNTFPAQTVKYTYNYVNEIKTKAGIGFSGGVTYSFDKFHDFYFTAGIGIGVAELKYTGGTYLKSIDSSITTGPAGNDGPIFGSDYKPDLYERKFLRLFIPFSAVKRLKNEKINLHFGGKAAYLFNQKNTITNYFPTATTVNENTNFPYTDFFVTGFAGVGYQINPEFYLSINYERSVTNLSAIKNEFAPKFHFQSFGINFLYRL